ncbi:nuclear transport factor 2 family protein [Streptomyces armeniacus]|uniref:Nuclear transport factor 2 family protein n=1 Tax=Streptomyces armeniacus TaxID=83291 RepID=A0A345XY96_9ACTN|nr:nuclear transport factor 2 family protein [Streptomyces armeniacus]AXK36612.1 nuclear transport factor 2 family protein [Streptomyces armeniacus]
MVQVSVTPDCGNAPKKLVLRDYVTALMTHDTDAVLSAVSDDVEWELVGRQTFRGRADFAAALDTALGDRAATLRLDTVLTHGDEGSVSSTVEFADDRRLRCCDVFKFSGHGKNAKIRRITSYWIGT